MKPLDIISSTAELSQERSFDLVPAAAVAWYERRKVASLLASRTPDRFAAIHEPVAERAKAIFNRITGQVPPNPRAHTWAWYVVHQKVGVALAVNDTILLDTYAIRILREEILAQRPPAGSGEPFNRAPRVPYRTELTQDEETQLDDAIAFVIGHEVAHTLQRHGTQRVSRAAAAWFLGISALAAGIAAMVLAGVALPISVVGLAALLCLPALVAKSWPMAVIGAGLLALVLSWVGVAMSGGTILLALLAITILQVARAWLSRRSHKDELDADRHGMELANKIGKVGKRGASIFLNACRRSCNGQTSSFSHPSNRQRFEALNQYLRQQSPNQQPPDQLPQRRQALTVQVSMGRI
jgi:hypothetical protein